MRSTFFATALIMSMLAQAPTIAMTLTEDFDKSGHDLSGLSTSAHPSSHLAQLSSSDSSALHLPFLAQTVATAEMSQN